MKQDQACGKLSSIKTNSKIQQHAEWMLQDKFGASKKRQANKQTNKQTNKQRQADSRNMIDLTHARLLKKQQIKNLCIKLLKLPITCEMAD